MTAKEKKVAAQELIMNHLAAVACGRRYNDFATEVGGYEEADKILISQMNRVAKLFGYKEAWFY